MAAFGLVQEEKARVGARLQDSGSAWGAAIGWEWRRAPGSAVEALRAAPNPDTCRTQRRLLRRSHDVSISRDALMRPAPQDLGKVEQENLSNAISAGLGILNGQCGAREPETRGIEGPLTRADSRFDLKKSWHTGPPGRIPSPRRTQPSIQDDGWSSCSIEVVVLDLQSVVPTAHSIPWA